MWRWADIAFYLLLLLYAVWMRPHSLVSFAAVAVASVAFPLWIVARVQLGSAFSLRAKAHHLVTTGLYHRGPRVRSSAPGMVGPGAGTPSGVDHGCACGSGGAHSRVRLRRGVQAVPGANVVLRKAGLPNEGMKLSKPEYLGGGWPINLAITRTGFAAYAQCSADSMCG